MRLGIFLCLAGGFTLIFLNPEDFLALTFRALIFVFPALFCIYNAVADKDYFFESDSALPFVFLFGRDGARVYYICFGILILYLAFTYFR
ncbi:MAG: hypothetical protein HQM09_11170 [Candidatus Riflebacteria bacterium]|nr:hypothetical protein [Candidatus Riflebacteria bacterium]